MDSIKNGSNTININDIKNNVTNGNNTKSNGSAGRKIVIIGGISAGTSAAAKARRFSEEAEIVIYEKYKYISYATCGLPYYVSEKISQSDDLLVNTASQFEHRFNLKVNVMSEVIKIDPASKSITIKNLESGDVFSDNYDRLIIATGTAPLSFNQELLSFKNVFSLRTVDDALQLKKYMDSAPIAQKSDTVNAVIVGGGYIGLELLEAFLAKNYKVTIIEKFGQILPVFDKEIIEYIENYLGDKKVTILKEEEIKETQKDDDILTRIITSKGTVIAADIVVLSIGARSETKLAADCGITIGGSGAIEVNEFLETNITDIYAAGDCCECKDFTNNKKQSFNLASIANIQGRCAGYNAAGGRSAYIDAIPTSIIKILDIVIGKTGMTLREAKKSGFNAKKIELHSLNHAGYYPGASMMHMILVYDEATWAILGFQAVGREGIDKKTDVMSVAIRAKMKVWELLTLNMSYQPAFGSAKDPLNMLGMIGENIYKGEFKLIDVEELRENIAGTSENLTVLDVRSTREYSMGHIETAINIPVDELRENIDKLDKKSPIVVYCRTSYRSYLAYRILENKGFENVRNLNGSYLSWARKI